MMHSFAFEEELRKRGGEGGLGANPAAREQNEWLTAIHFAHVLTPV